MNSSHGGIHGNVYKSVFGCEPTQNVIGSGFAYDPSKGWTWRSGVFNANDVGNNNNTWHTLSGDWETDRKMGKVEQDELKKAIKNWIENDQHNTEPNQDIVIFSYETVKKVKKVWHPPKTTYHNVEERYSSGGGCVLL